MDLNNLKNFALKHRVPIISDEGLELMLDIIKKHHIKHVLEIGTAIGYSALAMASYGCHVDTFERDLEMIDLANKHFDMFDSKHQIKLIPYDALTYQGPLGTYDLIFIDAAKSQYKRFFEKFEPFLSPDGMIICDNLRFHDLKPEQVNRHTKQLLRKIKEFKIYIQNHEAFDTQIYELGDGMSISQRKQR